MKENYRYDAFISYRHVLPDKLIASRLQKLLESYVPPKNALPEGEKKKLRLFRDETELPTSNDLGGDIRRALEESRFLVVICSPEYEKSKWCMAEVSYFKELHGGTNRNILTILADDPDKRPTFPEALRFETVAETLETGETVFSQREIEPLAANVCAKTHSQMLKKLKSEYLRIAAPLLGCGYDDLYQREQRRATQRKLRVAFGTAAVLAVAVVLSAAALLTIRAKNQQIAADALELRRNNAQLLLRESKMLEKDGDLYGALEAAVQAYPDEEDGFAASPGTLKQLSWLTDAYMPRSFAPARKIGLPSLPRKICLFEGGRRLAAATADKLILTDTETGETVKTIPIYNEYDVFFYRDQRVGDVSFSIIRPPSPLAGGAYDYGSINGISYTDMAAKDLKEEGRTEGEAIYLRNQQSKAVERISPNTGEIIWSFALDGNILNIKDCGCEGVLIEGTEGLILLAPETGEAVAEIGNIELNARTGGNSYYAHYMSDCLVLTYDEEGSERFSVFRRTESGFTFLFSSELFHDVTIGKSAFMIRDESVYVAGYASTGYLDNTAYLKAYDLKTGALRWEVDEVYRNVGVPFIGYAESKKDGTDPFGAVFAVVGERLFSVNVETGEEINRITLPAEVLELYCSDDGRFVLMTDAGGREMMVRSDRANSEVNLYLLREFSTEITKAAYCNNVYAVCRENAPEVLLYRPAEYDAREILCRSANDTRNLDEVAFNADGSLAAVVEAAPDQEKLSVDSTERQFHIIDPVSKKVLHTVSLGATSVSGLYFVGNDCLAIQQSYDTLLFYNARTGEKALELTEDAYRISKDMLACSPAGEIFVSDKEGMIYAIRPGETPEKLSALDFCGESGTDAETGRRVSKRQSLEKMYISSAGNQLLLWMNTSSTVSEGQKGEDGSVKVKILETNDETRLLLYDIAARTATECRPTEELDAGKLVSCVFTADESTVYMLFKDNTVLGFSFETGEQICLAPYDGNAQSLITLENDLCVLNKTGDIIKVRAQGSEITPLDSISLYDGSLSAFSFSYTSMQNGRGLLRYGTSGGWIIDRDAFEVVCEIDRCCGIDESRGRVYQRYYTCLYSYPLLSDADLLARGKARLTD